MNMKDTAEEMPETVPDMVCSGRYGYFKKDRQKNKFTLHQQ